VIDFCVDVDCNGMAVWWMVMTFGAENGVILAVSVALHEHISLRHEFAFHSVRERKLNPVYISMSGLLLAIPLDGVHASALHNVTNKRGKKSDTGM